MQQALCDEDTEKNILMFCPHEVQSCKNTLAAPNHPYF